MRTIKLLTLLCLASLHLTLFAAAETPKRPESKRRPGGASAPPEKAGKWSGEKKRETPSRPPERSGTEKKPGSREERRPGGPRATREKSSSWDRSLQKTGRPTEGKPTEREKRNARNRVEKAKKWERNTKPEPRSVKEAKLRDHVFRGGINKRGRPVGYHYEGRGARPPEGVRVIERSKEDSHGVYKAVLEATVGEKKKVKQLHTFFPRSWTKAQVERAMWEAYAKPEHVKDNEWRGKSSSGITVHMKFDHTNFPTTYYPKYEGPQ